MVPITQSQAQIEVSLSSYVLIVHPNYSLSSIATPLNWSFTITATLPLS